MNARVVAVVMAGLVAVVGAAACSQDAAEPAAEPAFIKSTIQLTSGEPDTRISYPAEGIDADHPNGNLIEVRNSKVGGDKTGEYIRTCIPVMDDEIECNGAFQLEDGTIEIETTAHDDPGEATAQAAIVGGIGAYAGALGTVDVDFENGTYTLNLLIPNV